MDQTQPDGLTKKPRFFEHSLAQLPPVSLLCDRCKHGLVFQPFNGIPSCYRCSEQMPGHAYVQAEALLTFLRTLSEDVSVQVRAQIEAWLKEQAQPSVPLSLVIPSRSRKLAKAQGRRG